MTKSKFKNFIFPLFFVAGLFFCASAFSGISKWFPFNRENALNEWDEKVFKGRVLYSVNLKQQDGYLIATSEQTSSGIFYRLNFNPRKFPMVSWKWKVIKFPDKNKQSDVANKWIEKDDYAARFYVIFPNWFFPNTKCLEYVWDSELAEGTIITSPYFENIKIIVAESGTKNLGNWVHEERNINEDFIKAFGRDPSSVGAIAIMTDSDNTLSTAEAYYDEIEVGYKK